MGCCFSGEEQAKPSELPPPQQGAPISVRLQKQGAMDADYDVLDISSGQPVPWMLIDTVGGLFSSSLKYYIKHRSPGQEESTVLGACEIRDSDTEFTWTADRKVEVDVDFDSDSEGGWSDDNDSDNGFFDSEIEITEKIEAKWKMQKTCHFFSDYNMSQHLGKLKVKAKGKYKRKTKTEIEWETYVDEDGNEQQREVSHTDVEHKTKLKDFHYKMDVMNTKINLLISKSAEGGSFWRAGHQWVATAENGANLFNVVGDGRNANVTTGAGTDPYSTLLAAFAVACQFNPEEVQSACESMCRTRI